MTTKFGHLEGRLTLTIGGTPVDLGAVQVPLTGYYDRGRVQLQLDVNEVAHTIREIFKTAEPPALEDGDR